MKKTALRRISDFIINKRLFIILVFAAAVIYCVLSMGRVRVNSDIKSLLPSGTDTRRGMAIMKEEFVTYGTADVMVSGVTYEQAEELATQIGCIDHVYMVTFDDTEKHYSGDKALFSVIFDGTATDETSITALGELRQLLSDKTVNVVTEVGEDYLSQLAMEVVWALVVSIAVIISVLLFTSRSYFEVVVFIIVFAVSVVLNMGTNFWLGEISAVTNSVAIVLQLALSIDYAIIFCHRFQDEYTDGADVRECLSVALSRSIIEISSSSLTTISGLTALTLMRFRLGMDLGSVLIKSIVCSMLTVFLLMPGMIMLFHRQILRSRHKSLVPDITCWGRFLAKGKPIFLILFAVMIPCVIYMSSQIDYTFSPDMTDRIRLSPQDVEKRAIWETFPRNNTVAVLVPGSDYEKQSRVIEKVSAMPEVTSSLGLAGVEVTDGLRLTDSVTADKFAALTGAEMPLMEKLFNYYSMFGGVTGEKGGQTSAPLVDLLEFTFKAIDNGLAELTDEQSARVAEVRTLFDGAVAQLKGENYSRIIFTVDLPIEGEEPEALISAIDAIAKEECGEGSLVIGDITAARDLHDSFRTDNVIVTVLTISFIFLVLFFAFRSVGVALLLILVIQGSIWLNFSFPFMTGTNLFFITYLIVSAIQMGATIDYAIVVYNRFRAAKELLPPKDAMQKAVNDSFPTIITSGIIMSAAGFIIGFMTTDLYVGSMGLAVGRGALISVIMVLTVLPQVILYGNRFAEITTVDFKRLFGKKKKKEE